MTNKSFQCPRCKTANESEAHFCFRCGSPLAQQPPPASTANSIKTLWITLGIIVALFGSCALFGIIGSLKDKSTNRITSNSSDPGPATASSNTPSGIDLALGIPAEFKPVYRVLEIKDESSATASRKVINVSLPKGLDKAAIENNLRSAAKELYEKAEPDALIVYGYLEGRTTDSSNVLGQLTFAPYGDWARASEKPSLDRYKRLSKAEILICRR